MGAGKTVITSVALARHGGTALIVAPRAVCRSTWATEYQQWVETAGLDVGVCVGTAAERRAVLRRGHRVLVINYENLPWLAREVPYAIWDVVVLDEITRFNKGGVRYKALLPFLRRATARWGLTGSFMASSPLDAYYPVYALDLGATFGQFVGRFRYDHAHRGMYEWEPHQDAAERIARRLEPLVYMPDPSVYQSQLPAVQRLEISVEIGATRVYQQLSREYAAEIDGGTLTVASAGVLGNKLAQIGSGFAYLEDGAVARFDRQRLDALEEIIAEADGPVLVWFWFAETGAALPYPSLLDCLDEWRAGRVPVALCHPRSGGHGINAQVPNGIMVWLEHTWSPEEREQAEARLHRQGQKTMVRIYDIMGTVDGEPSIDHAMKRKRAGKTSMAAAVTEVLTALRPPAEPNRGVEYA
jgi:hypothetical protein